MSQPQKDLPSYSNFSLPQAEESEMNVVGCLLRGEASIEQVSLSDKDFYSSKHQEIFSAMKNLLRQGIPIDIVTVFNEIKRAGKDEETGGSSYLTYLTTQTLPKVSFDFHVKQVREARIKRDLFSGLHYALDHTRNGGSLESIKAEISKLIQASEANTERPEMKKEAYYGLAGEIVNFISPHSEADTVALLANFLTAFGNVIGDKTHFRVEATKHFMRLFCVLVGDTSKGRKGTSWDYIENLFSFLEPEWVKNIQTGLSSGEGLIWAVRDEIRKHQPIREKGRVVDYEDVVIDKGVDDKRLLIVEGEFASPLRIMERDGNILSPIIRCAWDSGDLQVLTKNSPAKATGAHISIIGHVTKQELLTYLSTTEAGNGFGNRFLWLYVKRSKSLPFGGGFHKENLEPIIKKLKVAIEFAKNTGEITWAEKSRPLWEAVYVKLSEGKPGLIGALTARAEAYVTRLACIYALLDLSNEIQPEHLKAALAFWEYVEASVKYIFGNSSGIPLVNELRDALRERPMTRTEINDYFKGHKSSRRINEALRTLAESGEAQSDSIKTGGRAKEIWRLQDNSNAEKAENAEKG
ncbi:MAG: DnaB-like helicase N-terminal domain-containing protein [Ignavibacteriales bacterium]